MSAQADLRGRLDRCSINTATLGYQRPLGCTIDAIARAGFGWLAPWRRELEGLQPSAVARQIKDAGLQVSGYCRSTYFPALDRAAFEAAVADNCQAVEVAAELGAACFVLVVGSLPPGSRDLAAARAQVEEGTAQLLVHAKASGVRLALEPLHPVYAADRSCLNTLAQALDMATAIEPEGGDAPWLGVAVDAYHVWWDPDLDRQLERCGAQSRLFAFHVSDWRLPTRDPLNDRAMMGDGVIDLRGLRAKAEAAGYPGPVEVEIFSTLDWWQRPPEEILKVAAQRLQSCC